MRSWRAWLPIACLLELTGCALSYRTVGDQLSSSYDQLVVGTSTKSDALRVLGPPLVVRRQFDGDLFVYRQEKSRFRSLTLVPFVPIFYYSDNDARRIDVTLLFDHTAVLRGVGVQAEQE